MKCYNCALKVEDAVTAFSPSRKRSETFHRSCLERVQMCGHDWERALVFDPDEYLQVWSVGGPERALAFFGLSARTHEAVVLKDAPQTEREKRRYRVEAKLYGIRAMPAVPGAHAEPDAVKVTCETCRDTHTTTLGGTLANCTRCPIPCCECSGNRSLYCHETPCPCSCHKPKDPE